jgi:acyl-CoA synthetase (AMP-forming)/AMP-acid ligase II
MDHPPHDAGARTVDDVLRAVALAEPAREAYIHGAERLTFGQLERAVERWASALHDLGVGAGDVVALALPSSIDFACCYLGAARAGAITSAINMRLGAAERQSIIDRTEPAVTVVDSGIERPARAGAVVERAQLHDLMAGNGGAPRTFPARSPEDPVAIVWTSGTTGAPKGAVYDHAALREISRGMGALTAPHDRRLVALPFPHVGYMTRVWDELANATTLVLIVDPWSAEQHLRCIEQERITVATGVPTQWTLVLDHPGAARTRFDSLRLAGIGAATVPPALVRRMREALGCRVVQRYTSTEAGLLTGTGLDDPDDIVATTVGKPSPVVEMRLVDPTTGRDVEAGDVGTVGEIRCRSRAMFRGYWRDPELTRAALDDDGFLRTGDLGARDAAGNLRIVGRLEEMYIRGGYNIYPAEIEGVLADHPEVARAAVVATPDPVLGEIGVAFVVAAPGTPPGRPALDDLREWCRARLADYKAPDRLRLVADLPVTSMAKIDKQALAALATEE